MACRSSRLRAHQIAPSGGENVAENQFRRMKDIPFSAACLLSLVEAASRVFPGPKTGPALEWAHFISPMRFSNIAAGLDVAQFASRIAGTIELHQGGGSLRPALHTCDDIDP
jgi:hypothetical protein